MSTGNMPLCAIQIDIYFSLLYLSKPIAGLLMISQQQQLKRHCSYAFILYHSEILLLRRLVRERR